MFEVILLIIVQLIFEALPVSSSGHVLLTELLFRKISFLKAVSLPDLFDHLLQAPFIFIVLILFFKEWTTPFICLFKSLGIGGKKNIARTKKLWQIFLKIVGFVFVADFVTGIFYFIFNNIFKPFVSLHEYIFLFIGFVFTMSILYSLFFFKSANDNKVLNFKKSTLIGLAQGFALFPGVSRYAFTYVAGRWLGLSSRRAFQVSFLIGFPINIVGPLKGILDIARHKEIINIFSFNLFIIVILTTIVSYYLFKFTYFLILQAKLWLFSFYMFIPIILLTFLALF